MKAKNSKFSRSLILPGISAIIVAALLLFACNKTSGDTASEKNGKAEIATVLDNKAFSEKITTENENTVNYNPNDKVAVIDKIRETKSSGINNLQAKEVIVSKYTVTPNSKINDKIFKADRR